VVWTLILQSEFGGPTLVSWAAKLLEDTSILKLLRAVVAHDLKVFWLRSCAQEMPAFSKLQQQSTQRRDHAHHGVEIGGSKGEVALASKTPFNPTGTGNTAHLPAKFAFKGGYPGHELETQTIVDHREAARCQR
jgi:hypothetical protein